jgi:hypothetical protein
MNEECTTLASFAVQKTKTMRNRDTTKNRGKGRQFLLLIGHSSVYSYRQYVLEIIMRKKTQTT